MKRFECDSCGATIEGDYYSLEIVRTSSTSGLKYHQLDSRSRDWCRDCVSRTIDKGGQAEGGIKCA